MDSIAGAAKTLCFCYDRLSSLLKTLEITDVDDFTPIHLVADFATLIGTYSQGFAVRPELLSNCVIFECTVVLCGYAMVSSWPLGHMYMGRSVLCPIWLMLLYSTGFSVSKSYTSSHRSSIDDLMSGGHICTCPHCIQILYTLNFFLCRHFVASLLCKAVNNGRLK